VTGRWLTLSAAARQLGVSIPQVLDMGEQGLLRTQFQHDHWSVLEESVTAYLAEHADKPTVGRWSRADEPESFADRADYDTPIDEGDSEQ
jgi:hypothetical protein